MAYAAVVRKKPYPGTQWEAGAQERGDGDDVPENESDSGRRAHAEGEAVARCPSEGAPVHPPLRRFAVALQRTNPSPGELHERERQSDERQCGRRRDSAFHRNEGAKRGELRAGQGGTDRSGEDVDQKLRPPASVGLVPPDPSFSTLLRQRTGGVLSSPHGHTAPRGAPRRPPSSGSGRRRRSRDRGGPRRRGRRAPGRSWTSTSS